MKNYMSNCWLVIIASAWLSSCASAPFQSKISGKGEVKFTGWAKLSGEFIIYEDAESMSHFAKFPHCISGVFSDQYEIKDRSAYDGKFVTVTGKLFEYSQLPEDDSLGLPRKMLGGSVITNFCFGSNVLLIKTMKLASTSDGK